MEPWDYTRPWYHGAPLELRVLREGSTITQDRHLATVFSHKPTVVSMEDDGRLRHNGTHLGFLYRIAEPVRAEDVTPHPRTTMKPGDEWLTTRPLRLERLGTTKPLAEERLTEDDIAALREQAAS
jgi:hypothetical protein